MRARKNLELGWVNDSNANPKRGYNKKESSTFIVVVNKYPKRQMRTKDAAPGFFLAGLMLAVAAKWLGIW